MTQQTILLSKKGMKELYKKIAELEHRQKEARAHLRELDKGASHEERLILTEALAELEVIEDALVTQKELQRTAKLLPSKRARLKVAIGSVVDLIDQQGRMLRYTIVDSIEANPSDGRISVESPLGKSLLNKTIEETVEWAAGRHSHQVRLIAIR